LGQLNQTGISYSQPITDLPSNRLQGFLGEFTSYFYGFRRFVVNAYGKIAIPRMTLKHIYAIYPIRRM
jgi:hypothetical protein